jgi:hypothetical protein
MVGMKEEDYEEEEERMRIKFYCIFLQLSLVFLKSQKIMLAVEGF